MYRRENYDSTYYEIYALLSMEYTSKNFCKNFVKGESPDWQNEKDGISLEVTRAENNHIGHIKYLSNTYLGRAMTDIPPKVRSEQKGMFIYRKNSLYAISDSEGLVDGNRHIVLAIEKFKMKTELLNKPHFQNFNTNCLYLFLTNTALDCDIDLFRNNIQGANKAGRYYHRIILFDNSTLHVLSTEDNKHYGVKLEDRELAELKLKTKNMRKSSDWIEGTPFNKML